MEVEWRLRPIRCLILIFAWALLVAGALDFGVDTLPDGLPITQPAGRLHNGRDFSTSLVTRDVNATQQINATADSSGLLGGRTLNGYRLEIRRNQPGKPPGWTLSAFHRFFINMRTRYVTPIVRSVPVATRMYRPWPNRKFLFLGGNLYDSVALMLEILPHELYRRGKGPATRFTVYQIEAVVNLLEIVVDGLSPDDSSPYLKLLIFEHRSNTLLAVGNIWQYDPRNPALGDAVMKDAETAIHATTNGTVEEIS